MPDFRAKRIYDERGQISSGSSFRVGTIASKPTTFSARPARCRCFLDRGFRSALTLSQHLRDLDVFFADKDTIAREVDEQLRARTGELGLDVVSVGFRDLILPGDIKDLMNRVPEAKKAAEANLISRREETAAMRSQANTAKLLTDNPTLMRLRELEVLESIAREGKLNIVMCEKGLAERIINLQ